MYFVTSIRRKKDKDVRKFPSVNDARCWGYFPTPYPALNAVDTNAGDMHEEYYNWIVIEKIIEGINPQLIEEIWFKWDKGIEKWVHRDKPNWTPKIQKWAIG